MQIRGDTNSTRTYVHDGDNRRRWLSPKTTSGSACRAIRLRDISTGLETVENWQIKSIRGFNTWMVIWKKKKKNASTLLWASALKKTRNCPYFDVRRKRYLNGVDLHGIAHCDAMEAARTYDSGLLMIPYEEAF